MSDDDRDHWLKDAPALIGAVAVAAGVIVYGLLATAYDKFYAELGLTPADVGVQYGKTLGGAAALTILVFVCMATTTGGVYWLLARIESATGTTPLASLPVQVGAGSCLALLIGLVAGTIAGLLLLATVSVLIFGRSRKLAGDHSRRVAVSAAGAAGLTWLLLTATIGLYANDRADEIKNGGWIEPPASAGLVFFSVRAMPTRLLAATDSTVDQRLARERNRHTLRFLGLSNSLLVIYDSTAQEALLLPTTAFRAPIVNCETSKMRDSPLCAQP